MDDVDSIYEERLAVSDLDIEGFDDEGDDPPYLFTGDVHPLDMVECQACGREVRWMDSAGYDTDDVYCQRCWREEIRSNG